MTSPLSNHLSRGLQTVTSQPTPIPIPVSGLLPSYLATSTLFRQGPGRYEVTHRDGNTTHLRHWFDGYALVHAFQLDAAQNKVSYHSNFICPGAIRAAESVDKAAYVAYMFARADPCQTLLGRFMQLWTKTPVDPNTGFHASNVCVTLQTVPGKGNVVARTDFNANCVLDEQTLEVDQFFKFHQLGDEGEKLNGTFTAAHGQFDANAQEFWNYSFDVKGRGNVVYRVFKVSADGKAHVVAEVTDKPAYVHSFAITDNYLVLVVWPLYLEPLQLLTRRSLMDSMNFDNKATAKFHVVKRHGGGVVATYEAASFFCFHTINAFEKDNEIHIDLCRYKDANILDQFTLDYMRTATKFDDNTLTRFTLPNLSEAIALGPGSVQEARQRVLSGVNIELPRINPDYHRKEHRYVYGVSGKDENMFSEVCKVDVETGERAVWSMEGGVVGEPIFVPDNNGLDEDDGCVLVVVLDGAVGQSSMVVLNAREMVEVARATVPQVVPLGFHGMFHVK